MNNTSRFATSGYKALRAEFGIMWDGEDPWGSALDWWFAIAEFLYHNEPSMVPESWEFQDSPAHVPPVNLSEESVTDAMVWEMYDAEEITIEDALTFGVVLGRYLDMLRAAGLNY